MSAAGVAGFKVSIADENNIFTKNTLNTTQQQYMNTCKKNTSYTKYVCLSIPLFIIFQKLKKSPYLCTILSQSI